MTDRLDAIAAGLRDGRYDCRVPEDTDDVRWLVGEVRRLRERHAETNREICQTLGKALGYPWFKDDQKNFPGATEAEGVCVGDHVAESLAVEAGRTIERHAEAVEAAEAEVERLNSPVLKSDWQQMVAERDAARAKADRTDAILRQLAKDGRLWIDQKDLLNARVRLVYEPEHQPEIAAARAEAETERMRLVACGVAAMQNTEAAATERIGRDNPCWSASYGDVCAAVDREMAHRAEAARLRELVAEVRKCGTEEDDPRLHYMTVQIDKGLWGGLMAALDTPAREGGEG